MTAIERASVPVESASVDDWVVSARNVSKRLCRDLKLSWRYGLQDVVHEFLASRRDDVSLRPGEFWVVDDLSFELKRGQSLAVIGPNGAGKTTLLKVIAGLLTLSRGELHVRGRVVPLMALGVGFRSVLSGRENIVANLALFGLSDREILGCIDEIIEFAELGDAIDSPVQTYSKGMYLRLAFACAIQTKPDVLLIDELLAVGDRDFQRKCFKKMAELKSRGTSFIITTHYPMMVKDTCEVALLLDRGKLVRIGPADQVITEYEQERRDALVTGCYNAAAKSPSEKSDGVRIEAAFFRDSVGEMSNTVESGKPFTIGVRCLSDRTHQSLYIETRIWRRYQVKEEPLMSFSNQSRHVAITLGAGASEVRIRVPHCRLTQGDYRMNLIIRDDSGRVLDSVQSLLFSVAAPSNRSDEAEPESYSVVIDDQERSLLSPAPKLVASGDRP